LSSFDQKVIEYYNGFVSILLSRNPKRKSINGLSTIPVTRTFRMNRLKSDLDRAFIEETTKQESAQVGMQYVDLYGFPIDTNHISMIEKENVANYRIGVFSLANKVAYVCTDQPGLEGQKALTDKIVESGYTIKLFLCSSLSIEKLIKTFDHVIDIKAVNDDIVIKLDKVEGLKKDLKNLVKMNEILNRVSVSDFMETVLIGALENKASDIHFEPEKDFYHLRLRLDGVLYNFATLPTTRQKQIESRLKILSGVKINVSNIPQDGRFSFKFDGRDIDVRVSMLPSNYGYSVVMRLLGTGEVNLKLEELGFTGEAKKRIELALQKPQGLILTTGPTGSGKTTTLYTFLTHLNDGSNKIITLEDPIEYKISGVSQTQIDSESGYTFAGGLRSILRQDPDIVMVGEIRDPETADVALQAALTGHQVLSTIHTNDAAGAIPRLFEMGQRGFILTDAVSVIVGQRLIRKICQHCKKTYHPNDDEKNIIKAQISMMNPQSRSQLPHELKFFSSPGCLECNNLGYKGRIGVYEVMTMTDSLRELISVEMPSIVAVKNAAMADGMLNMFQDGLFKALTGMTDIAELRRNIQT
jgi:type IV pilus assembly protein PilB